jgi:aspartate-semialdehyde dehydrogenase
VLCEDSFKGVDVALFSAGGGTSKKFAPAAAKAGCVVIDNSSAWRMDPEVPLVVPEVNAGDHPQMQHKGIIANPNCSTIQMVVVLKPLHDAAKIKRVVVSTYQAVSGAGIAAIGELREQTRALVDDEAAVRRSSRTRSRSTCIPQIPQSDAFTGNGYTSEEMKMVNETKKIMGDDVIRVTATTVRVPVQRPQRVGERRNGAEAQRRRGARAAGKGPRRRRAGRSRRISCIRWPSTPRAG